MNSNPSFDVIVIGAGMGGLLATKKLVEAAFTPASDISISSVSNEPVKLRVLLLEARDRVGGRLVILCVSWD